MNEEQKTNKNLVPYFVAAHPGSTIKDMEDTKVLQRQQAFCKFDAGFTPTPGTLSTAMYYTGENPMTRGKDTRSRTFREEGPEKHFC